mmetsp:Transcript_8773/g.25064  ORF Transcript_8773/g.25064 Transcript_8773/m.25064 type:complete len:94 (-) Transcript_8773:795-1076(-)
MRLTARGLACHRILPASRSRKLSHETSLPLVELPTRRESTRYFAETGCMTNLNRQQLPVHMHMQEKRICKKRGMCVFCLAVAAFYVYAYACAR